ncbi:MAG: succinate dehydrogenase [Chlamydiales bacterium]|nr:succinate dehydrogenase [Chlamydiales bacterium]
MTTPTHEKVFPEDKRVKLPLPFIFRRLHSLLGVWLVLFLFEHLLTNSQAALFFYDDGYTFVRMVNKIHELPYLRAIEILFLGLPFLIHGLWGVHYAITSRTNSFSGKGKTPALPQYKRNRAFTWQRVTAWVVVVGVVLHVIQMRFMEYPTLVVQGDAEVYMVQVKDDAQSRNVAKELKAEVYRENELAKAPHDAEWRDAAMSKKLKKGQVLVAAPNAGAAIFFVVRDTFKSPLMVLLYSIFVVTAVYHAFNGLWTAFISWGITLTRRSQKKMRYFTTFLMWVVMIFGLMACWGPYWTFVWH